MAVVEKPKEDKILLVNEAEFSEYTPKEACTCWVNVNITAPHFNEKDNSKLRAAVDIVAVIDRSGSMSSGKLDRVKKTLYFILSQLTPRDRLSLIVYDDNVKTIFPLTHIIAESKSSIQSAIDTVQTGASTNLCAGLLEGMKCVMERTGEKAQVSSVLLLTDGMANVGIVDPCSIVNAMKDPYNGGSNSASSFVGTVYTFGFGSDHNAKLLQEISTAGEGVYYYIDTDEKVPHCFADCLGGLLSTVGQAITLSLKLTNNVTIANISAKNTAKYDANKTSAEICLGDIQSEEQRDIMIELQLPCCGPDSGVIDYGVIALSYVNVITSKRETANCNLFIKRADSGTPKQPNLTIDRQRNRILAIRAISDARAKASNGDYEEGRKILNDVKENILASITAKDPTIMTLIEDINDCIRGMVDVVSFSTYGGSKTMTTMQSHSSQRCTYSGGQERVSSYTTTSRMQSRESSENF